MVRTVVALVLLLLVGMRLISNLRERESPVPVDPSSEETEQTSDPTPPPSRSPDRRTGDRVRNEPTSGLWIFGILALALLYLTWWLEPGRDTAPCLRSLAELPTVGPDSLLMCGDAPISLTSALLHILLIATYTWFFRECVSWGHRCLPSQPVRRFLKRWGSPFVYLPAVVHIAALIITTIQHWAGTEYVSATGLAWVTFLPFVPNLVIAAIVLVTGMRRFALPWTVPPGFRAVVPHDSDASPGTTAADDRSAVSELEPIPSPIEPANSVARWFSTPEEGLYQPVPYGIGLSGGGVRSAAFCSGVLQSLAGSDWSPTRAAYLATVSGGGFVGVSTQIIRHELLQDGVVDKLDPYAADAPETKGFADRHRYLGDDALERAQVLLALVTGLIINSLLIAGPLAVIGAALAVAPNLPPELVPTVRSVAIAVLLLGALLLLLSGAEGSIDKVVARFSRQKDRKDTERAESTVESWAKRARWFSGLCAVAGSVGLILSLPFDWSWRYWTVGFAVAGGVMYGVATWRSCAPLQNVARVLFVSGWVSVALIGMGAVANGEIGNPTDWNALLSDTGWQVGLALAIAALISAFMVLDQTLWSPHPFYKARIAGTFSVRRTGLGSRRTSQRLSYDEYSYLNEWATPAGGPQLLVCATANAEDISLPPTGTRAVPFVFSHDYVGSPELGWWRTADFRRCLGRRLARDGTLQAATAISGAAVASGLGVQGRIPSVGTALALLNARLGVWLPNPHAKKSARGWPDDSQTGVSWSRLKANWVRRRRPLWLWREVAGYLPSIKRYIYVSDGGHLDNLGLLELLRRRTKVILIVDASADRASTTNTLDGVLELARKHLQTTVVRDKAAPLTTKGSVPEGLPSSGLRDVTADCVEFMPITYPELSDTAPAMEGLLVVAKARLATTLFDDEEGKAVACAIDASHTPRGWPWSLRSLPTTMTANQWLTNDQFRNYVLLGRAVGRHAVARLDEAAPRPPLSPGTEPAPAAAQA